MIPSISEQMAMEEKGMLLIMAAVAFVIAVATVVNTLTSAQHSSLHLVWFVPVQAMAIGALLWLHRKKQQQRDGD